MITGFVPGVGIGIVTDRLLALVEHASGELVADVQAHVESGVDGVLEALAAAGLRSLGSFAVAVDEGAELRVVVRGDAWVRVADGGEVVVIGGAGLRTWNEQVLSGWQQVVVGLGQWVDAPSQFEVDRGVVPAAALLRPNVATTAEPTGSGPGAPHVTVVEITDVVDADPEPDVTGVEPVETHPVEPSGPVAEAVGTISVGDDTAHAGPVESPVESDDELPVDSAQTILPSAFAPPSEPLTLVAEVPRPEPARPPGANAYDDMYGHTVHREVQSAAVRAAEEPPPALSQGDHDGHTVSLAELRRMQQAEMAASPRLGDHDGHTVSVAELRSMQAAERPPMPQASPAPLQGVTVQALVCVSGHPNPVHASVCSKCRQPLDAQPVIVARPVLGRLVLSTGESVELDTSVIIGRNPKVEGRLVGELPKTVRLESFQGLSRSHAMVRLEGWQVLLVDLGSANFTTLTLPGRPPQRLRADEPAPLADGATIDLGGEVTIRYEADA